MSRVREDEIRRALREAPVPDARDAEERGWAIVSEAFAEREPVERRPSNPRRAALGLLGAGVVAAFALTPAGADVRDWIADTISGEESAKPVLESLPAPGAVLTESGDGVWILRDDGSRRRLGDYDHATWSPHGLYVGASSGSELLAVDPQANVEWTRPTPGEVRAIDWSSDDGFRLAYVSGNELFVVPGDNAGEPVSFGSVDSPAIAWRPESSEAAAIHQLAYTDGNRVVLVDTDSQRAMWRSEPITAPVRSLAWSADGERLLVVAGDFAIVLGADGESPLKGPIATGVTAAALAPDGRRVAVVRESARGGPELALVSARPFSGEERVLYRSDVPGDAVRFGSPTFSPDGRWILLPWPQADQWLFVPVDGGRIRAVADISAQLDPDRRGNAAFPRVAGWCCS